MGNRVISNSFRGIEIFLNVLVIIIIRFGENNVRNNIYLYILISCVGGGTWFT